jgi:hypothetical protein
MPQLIVRWFFLVASFVMLAGVSAAEAPVELLSPTNGETLSSSLSVVLRWHYPQRPRETAPFPFLHMTLQVAENPEFTNALVDIDVPDNRNSYPMAIVPGHHYYWRLTPMDEGGGMNKYHTELRATGSFTAGEPRNLFSADDPARYENPRVGAHWQYMKPVVPLASEPLSPWYEVKAFRSDPLPVFDQIKSQFPVPVWDGHPEALQAWWYCWETLFRVWIFAPDAPDHDAVANLLGYRNWGPWGSTMVFDSCFILHFSRFGAQAWPFITCLDNCYARQHGNGFICRESDRENHEVYATFPVNPPLFAWSEWEWYKVAGDKERLRRVLMPIVKHYEWWMTYQRRENGLYWVQGVNEADDSPRNTLMYYSVSASSYQALAALYLARMAGEIGRPDLQAFFTAQHEELAKLVNDKLWDEKHQLYNDITKDGRFITELEPNVFCKHIHMFWPLLAEIAPPDRRAALVTELAKPSSFNRASGFASLSADSRGYNAANGQYWCGAVWPSAQSMVQEGLKKGPNDGLLQSVAEKYYNATLTAFVKQKTIQENLAPDQAVGYGAADFVGWGGIGPVANLVEYILGFDLNAPERTITWDIRRLERHGLQNLQFGGFKVDMVCAARPSEAEPCRITVKSGGAFTLRLRAGAKTLERRIAAGEQTIVF